MGYYDDPNPIDPSALNEALTATRPSDIAAQTPAIEAAYAAAGLDLNAPVVTTTVTGVAEVADPAGQQAAAVEAPAEPAQEPTAPEPAAEPAPEPTDTWTEAPAPDQEPAGA